MAKDGYNTQFIGNSSGSYRDIGIGLDYGTSSTKVVVQDPVLRNAFAVPFGGISHPKNVYLIPSRLGISFDGRCQLVGFNQRGGRGLKLALMKSPKKIAELPTSRPIRTNALALVSIYIALVLQEVRMWFLGNFKNEYGTNRIRWYLNVGIPTPNYDDRELCRAFLDASRIGWRLSLEKEQITVQTANEFLRKSDQEEMDLGIHPDQINTVPEVAAEVASYARSPLREMGLHMIVDVGANTMDVATFRIEAPEAVFEYWYLYSEVCEYACHKLHTCRLEQTKKGFDRWFEELRRVDDNRAEIPQSYGDYSPPENDLTTADQEFIDMAKLPISRAAAKTYLEKDPNAREWKNGVPLFICGGGSNLGLFAEDVIASARDLLRGYKIADFRIRSLPKPDNLVADKVHPREFHRLAVAYGLSFFYDDIGRIVPPSGVGNIEKIERIKVVDYVSKDKV